MHKHGDDYVYKGWRIKPFPDPEDGPRTAWHVYPPGWGGCPTALYVEGAATVQTLADAKRYVDGGIYNGPMTDEGDDE
jgi:hypothetical protein